MINNIEIYSDHLCFSDDKKGYLSDLLPVPIEKENILYISNRIEQVQDILKKTSKFRKYLLLLSIR
ncbi:MAG: DUF692 family multinuclear iron-containing protein [Francisella endosymbiont of Hyalomma scupense]